jgi:ATP-dependent DNA ligase
VIVSTVNGLRVRSRRGWNMTEQLPELRYLPGGLVLDGELVAWKSPPELCENSLPGDRQSLHALVRDRSRPR